MAEFVSSNSRQEADVQLGCLARRGSSRRSQRRFARRRERNRHVRVAAQCGSGEV